MLVCIAMLLRVMYILLALQLGAVKENDDDGGSTDGSEEFDE